MSSDLIPVVPAVIGDTPVNTVDARVLHAFLEVQSDFRNWIKNRIDRYGFVENQDFVTVGKNLPGGGKQNDYHVTLDMAKELAMVERNAKGKQARQYFIECERQVIEGKPTLPRSYAEALRLAADQQEQLEQQQQELESTRPKALFHDQVVSSETLMDFASMFSLLQRKTGQRFNRASFLAFARRHAIACQANPYNGSSQNRFVPRQAYIGSWFVSEMHGNGVTEWKVRPIAIAGIVQLIEFDRNQSPFSANDDQEAA